MHYSVLGLIAIILIAIFFMARRESFAISADAQCSASANNYCSDFCSGEMSQGAATFKLSDVIDKCGSNFMLNQYCFEKFDGCPLNNPLDTVTGGNQLYL